MAHDFKKFPELTNRQMELYYFNSPHIQLFNNFTAKVVRVIDGDTISLEIELRDFNFPLRFSNLAAPETKEAGGLESKRFMEEQILNQDVDIELSKQRVEKWGRLLGKVFHMGMDMGELSQQNGHGLSWDDRTSGRIPDIEKELEKAWST